MKSFNQIDFLMSDMKNKDFSPKNKQGESYFPSAIEKIVLSYVDGDFPNLSNKSTMAPSITLFSKRFFSIENTVTELGEALRRREENEVNDALNIIKKHPKLLNVRTTTEGPNKVVLINKTLNGNCIYGG